LPSGSLSQDTAANQESNQYFDLPAGVNPDGKGGYVNNYGDVVDVSGNVISLANGAGGYDQYMPELPPAYTGDYSSVGQTGLPSNYIPDYTPGGSAGDEWYYE
jgi:hypothetical protein